MTTTENQIEHDFIAKLGELKYTYRQDKDVQTELGISTPTANALVKVFLEKGLLKELTGQQRSRIYVCEPYLKIFVS